MANERKTALHEWKKEEKSSGGKSGKKIVSRKQDIAIAIKEARRTGEKKKKEK